MNKNIPLVYEQPALPTLDMLATGAQESYLAYLETAENQPRGAFVMGEIGSSAEDQAKRGWSIELDGVSFDQPIRNMQIDLPDGISLEYGKRPEGYDAPVIRTGIRVATAPYIVADNGTISLGRIMKKHTHIVGEFVSLPEGLPKPGGESTVLATGINNNSAFIDTSTGLDGLAIVGQRFKNEDEAREVYGNIVFSSLDEALDTPDIDVKQATAFIIDSILHPERPHLALEDLKTAYSQQTTKRAGRLALSAAVPRVSINGVHVEAQTIAMTQSKMGVSLEATKDGLSLSEQGGGGVVTGIYAHETYAGEQETYILTLTENRLATGGLIRNVLRGFLDTTDADRLSAASRESREELGDISEYDSTRQTVSLLAKGINPDYRIFKSQTEEHPDGGVSFHGLSLSGDDINVVLRPNGQKVAMFSDRVRKMNEGLENSKKVELILGARGLQAVDVLGVDGFTNAVAAELLVRDYESWRNVAYR